MTRASSPDGTEIAWWTTGAGPPLVLVHGAISDHERWRPLLPHLEPHATVHALDRRGRGASGDGARYDVEREFEDVAAVVDAVAEAADAKVDLYGHSFGGLVAFGAATLSGNVRRLVLYEGWPAVDVASYRYPPDVVERVEASIAAGDRDAAVETVCREIALMSAGDIAALRSQPAWRARMAAVHTIARELDAIAAAPLDPARAAAIAAPTLLLVGGDSSDPSASEVGSVAAALPDARIEVLEGQAHVADVLAPELFARSLLEFLRA